MQKKMGEELRKRDIYNFINIKCIFILFNILLFSFLSFIKTLIIVLKKFDQVTPENIKYSKH